MYSELEKWIVMREMVKEKQLELSKYVNFLSSPYDVDARLKQINAFIKSRFVSPKDKNKYNINWRDNLSAVDLLHLFNYINRVLYSFYKIAPVTIEPKGKRGDIITNYYMVYCGEKETYYNYDNMFEDIMRAIKCLDKVSKFCITKKPNKTIRFSPPAKDKRWGDIDLFSQDVREEVVAELINDAVKRYEDVTNTKQNLTFEEKKKEFCLYPSKASKVLTLPKFDVEKLEKGEQEGVHKKDSIIANMIDKHEVGEQLEIGLIPKMLAKSEENTKSSGVKSTKNETDEDTRGQFVGVDMRGMPVYSSKDGLFDGNRNRLPDDTYVDSSATVY